MSLRLARELELPPDFTSLLDVSQVPNGPLINLIGVVTDYMPEMKNQKNEWQVKIGLQDPSNLTSFDMEGLKLTFFQKVRGDLPQIGELGDIVIFRNMRHIKSFAGRMLVNSSASKTVVFPGSAIPDAAFGETSQGECYVEMRGLPRSIGDLTPREKLYVMHLHQWAIENGLPARSLASSLHPKPLEAPSGLRAMPHMPTGPRLLTNIIAGQRGMANAATGVPSPRPVTKDKFSLLRHVGDRTYCDLVGEVRRTFYTGNQCVIYFTDYTENSLFYDYSRKPDGQAESLDGDPYNYASNTPKNGWHGPFGKMTIQIRLWTPHDEFARENVNEGDIFFLRNTNIMFKQGKYLEGNLRTDQRHPEQVDIRQVGKTDPRLAAFHQRRNEYWELEEKLSGRSKKSSKQAKKEKRKREKVVQKLQKKQKLGQDEENADDAVHDNKSTRLTASTTKPILNSNVVCAYEDKPLLTISDILDTPYLKYTTRLGRKSELPFVNMKSRVRVRVIDFYPPNLEDFAQCIDQAMYDDMTLLSPDEDVSGDDSSLLPTTWEWAFYLLVEEWKCVAGEEPRRMRLLVAGGDAEYLLRLDANDLRHKHHNPQKPQVIDELREKLFLLWGNVGELKVQGNLTSEGVTNRPFECCIKEYGVEHDGTWIRMHRMFGTTIR